jgi:hypothetical protein
MKTLIAAVAYDSVNRTTADRNTLVAQYCIPQEDDSVTIQKIYCRGAA